MESTLNTPLFFLVAFLCLFGYLIYNNFVLNSRIEQLKESMGSRRDPSSRLSPFSWDLLDIEEGLPLLGEGLSIHRCGLYLVGARDRSLLETLASNMIYQVLSIEDIAVVYASRRMGPQQLGRRLLSLEAGVPWETLGSDDKRKTWARIQREVERYEASLFLWQEMSWSAERLLEACQELREGQDIAAIVVDEPELLAGTEAEAVATLERLRLVSLKCGAPIFLLLSTQPAAEFTRWQTLGGERLQGVLEFEGPQQGGGPLQVHFIKYPEAPPVASFELNAETGQIVQT